MSCLREFFSKKHKPPARQGADGLRLRVRGSLLCVFSFGSRNDRCHRTVFKGVAIGAIVHFDEFRSVQMEFCRICRIRDRHCQRTVPVLSAHRH